MQKSVPKSGESTVRNIFQTMAYNENQIEDYSTILNWLSGREYKIWSTVGGVKVESGGVGERKLEFRQKVVSVGCLDAKIVEPIVTSLKRSEERLDSWDEKGAFQRLQKFEKLLQTLTLDLSLLESFGCKVPSWQIAQYDQSSWNIQRIASQLSFSQGLGLAEKWRQNVVQVAMKLGTPLERVVGGLALGVALFEGPLVLSISVEEDVSCILSMAYLIDGVNKTNIRSSPIDLLILNGSKGTHKALLVNPECKFILPGNNDFDLPLDIVSGVVTETKVKCLHFVVDSTADVKTAVESISEKAWCSGTQVRMGGRNLVFIHQPIYGKVIELLEQKIKSLRITSDPGHKLSDFIRRNGIQLKKELALGVKVVPESGDLSGPTVIYDIGTSTDIVANKVSGLGHIMCAIPYRSKTELLSLANIYGHNIQTHIFASDSAVVKKIATNIKGEIWVNSSGKYNGDHGLTINSDWIFCQPPPKTTSSSRQTAAKLLDLGLVNTEKALKSWSSQNQRSRLDIVERVLELVFDKTVEIERYRCLLSLMREIHGDDGESLKILRNPNPVGIVGIVVESVNADKISLPTLILAIMSCVVKGNAAIVISVENQIPKSIVEACNSNFPLGILNFINSSTTNQALASLHAGNVNHVWLIHSGQRKMGEFMTNLSQFNTVVIHQLDLIKKESVGKVSNIFENKDCIHW